MEDRKLRLTEAEWSMMEALWTGGSLTGREAAEQMAGTLGWSRSTTLTHLRRMEEKHAVASRTVDGVKRFFPQVGREDAAMQETESFLDRVYQGSLSMMVSALTRKQTLPKAEIQALHALLDGLEAEHED